MPVSTNGAFLSGATQAAGEVGYMVLDPGGPVCGCGTKGCSEALASRTAFNKVKAAVEAGEKTLLFDPESGKVINKVRSGKLRRAVEAGDELATRVLDETCLYTGIAIANLCNLLNPEIVALGGMIEQLHETMLPKITEAAVGRMMPARGRSAL